MTRYNAEALYNLLPQVYRTRDAVRDFPLRDLITILASQAEELELDIAQLYQNEFIETAAPWAIPYIGDLIGVRFLPPAGLNGRAEVADMIGYRRRKGTAAVLEQLARDVTQWPAHVVEYFDLLPTTQYMNHLRLHRPRTPDLRNAFDLEYVDHALDIAAHTVDVRHIASRRGRHNTPNVGLYLFRLEAFPLQLIEPNPVGNSTDGRYTFSTLGNMAPLFHEPVSETSASHIAEEANLPVPIRPRALHADLTQSRGEYYGGGRSIAILTPTATGWELIQGFEIVACDLASFNRSMPPNSIGIDPVRGRLAFSDPTRQPERFRLSYRHGFSAPIGGGQYERASTILGDRTAVVGDPNDPLVAQVRADLPPQVGFFDNIADALVDAQGASPSWNPGDARVIEIVDSRIYREALPALTIPTNARFILRAANEQRPTLVLPSVFSITGGDGSAAELNGLLISGAGVDILGTLNQLVVAHCTLVPGLTLDSGNIPGTPGAVSITIGSNTTEATISSSILGAVRTAPEVTVSIADSILDAHRLTNLAYGGAGNAPFGGPLSISRSTVVGAINTTEMTLGENDIFLGVVTAERRQSGCVRFSWVPPGSRVPRRFHCQPEIPDGTPAAEAAGITSRLAPRFTTLIYGGPGYGQLDWRGPAEIYRGAEDQSEMGVFSSLNQPQREDGLRIRLDEFLPVQLEAGIFFST
jgi:hypothetical protein